MPETVRTNEEVIVIGAGIVGICSALSILDKVKSVRLIDPNPPASGTSYGNAGVISPWSSVPQSLPGLWKHIPRWVLDPEGPVAVRIRYLPRLLPWFLKFLRAGQEKRVHAISDAMDALARPNIGIYRRHLQGTGDENLIVDSWYVLACRNPRETEPDRLGWQLRAKHGAEMEVVDGETMREIEPALSSEYKAAILVKGQSRAVSPGRLGMAIANKFRKLGGEILRGRVHQLAPVNAGGWHLTTDLGVLRADKVVVAAGAWSAKLLEPLGLSVPLEAERGYHMVFRSPGVSLTHSIMDMDRKFVTSSMETGIRSAGTAEFSGLNASPNFRRASILRRLTKQMLPDLNTDDTEEWTGIRPSLPDSLPCVGEIPAHSNLYAAFGHSHYGLGMAPQTGQVIANLVSGFPPGIDLTPYRMDRF